MKNNLDNMSATSKTSEIAERMNEQQKNKTGDKIKLKYTARKEAQEKQITDKELATLENSNKLGSEAKQRSDENNIPNMNTLLTRKGYPQT